jgi:hypothetical protein
MLQLLQCCCCNVAAAAAVDAGKRLLLLLLLLLLPFIQCQCCPSRGVTALTNHPPEVMTEEVVEGYGCVPDIMVCDLCQGQPISTCERHVCYSAVPVQSCHRR